MKCRRCKEPAQVALPSHNTAFCPDCFFLFYLRQIERAVKDHAMLVPEDRVLVALSGGKDSLALMVALHELGYDVTGLHISLGIPGSSDEARRIVTEFCAQRGFALEIVDTPALGLAIPEVKARLRRPICAVCGKIKRHYFNLAAIEGGYSVLATGHNLDDETARLFANTIRWDPDYLAGQGPSLPAAGGFPRKVKPLYRLGEFENACFAFLKGLTYATTPCPYSQGASFTGHKALLETLELRSPGAKIAFYDGFLARGRPAFEARCAAAPRPLVACAQCGAPTNESPCGVCRIRALLAETPDAV